MPFNAYKRGLRSVAARLAGRYRHVLFDIQNEFDTGRQSLTLAEAREIVDLVHATDRGRITTASPDGTVSLRKSLADIGAISHQIYGDVVAFHSSRAQAAWFTLANVSAEIAGVKCGLDRAATPIFYEEPMPFRQFGSCRGQAADPTRSMPDVLPRSPNSSAQRRGRSTLDNHSYSGRRRSRDASRRIPRSRLNWKR
jgi:hypothetical protein